MNTSEKYRDLLAERTQLLDLVCLLGSSYSNMAHVLLDILEGVPAKIKVEHLDIDAVVDAAVEYERVAMQSYSVMSRTEAQWEGSNPTADRLKKQLLEKLTQAHKRIAELESLEHRHQQAVEQMRFQAKLLDNVRESVITTDLEGRVTYWGQGAEALYGYTAEDVLGKHISFLEIPETDEIEERRFHRAQETGSWRGQCKHKHKDGTLLWTDTVISPVADQNGRTHGLISVSRDITEQKRLEEKLAHMATHDALTDLPNRRLFNDRLTLALAQARRHHHTVAVLMLDLDFFKHVNDTLGHTAGDQLLKDVSRRLSAQIREADTIARIGGDEFMLLLPAIDDHRQAVDNVAQRVQQGMQEPFVAGGEELHVTTSIGIALFPDHGQEAGVLMRQADIAMYHAKQRGRNNYQYYATDISGRGQKPREDV